jgi:hypothetical protein
MSHRVDPAAIAEKLEPCGWMPFSGLPDGPFRWGIVQRQNRGLCQGVRLKSLRICSFLARRVANARKF